MEGNCRCGGKLVASILVLMAPPDVNCMGDRRAWHPGATNSCCSDVLCLLEVHSRGHWHPGATIVSVLGALAVGSWCRSWI